MWTVWSKSSNSRIKKVNESINIQKEKIIKFYITVFPQNSEKQVQKTFRNNSLTTWSDVRSDFYILIKPT